jgi:hypothetical protein
MCAEASTVLRAVAADFFFSCWYLEIPLDNRIQHIPRCVDYHAQGFRLGNVRISMLEVEAIIRDMTEIVRRSYRTVCLLLRPHRRLQATGLSQLCIKITRKGDR